MNKETLKILKEKKQKKEFTCITRKFGGKYTKRIERGIVHNISNKLIKLCSVEDFRFEESAIFPVKHILKLRFNKNDKYFDKILQLEKIPNQLKNASNPNLNNWRSFFNSLKTDCIIIETENSKNRTFHIGGITEIKRKKMLLQPPKMSESILVANLKSNERQTNQANFYQGAKARHPRRGRQEWHPTHIR